MVKNKNKKIGKRLKKLREQHNLSKEQISLYLTDENNYPKFMFSVEDVTKLENGEKNLPLSIIDKLCSLYCCDYFYLLFRSNEYNPLSNDLDLSKKSTDDLKALAAINNIYVNYQMLNGLNIEEFTDEQAEYYNNRITKFESGDLTETNKKEIK